MEEGGGGGGGRGSKSGSGNDLDVVEHGNKSGEAFQLLSGRLAVGSVDGGVDGVFDQGDADAAVARHRFQVRHVVARHVVATQGVTPVDAAVVCPRYNIRFRKPIRNRK